MSKAKARRSNEKKLRQAVVATARDMSFLGLSPGKTGNVSARFGDGMLITPTALAYDKIDADDIVMVDGDGGVAGGQLAPSSEWRFHLAAYAARLDRHALVHTHSMHATALACARKSIPAFHYMVAGAGGNDIPCTPYATFGTSELAAHVAAALETRDACLMANHGQIALGETLENALALAFDIETLAEQFLKATLVGPVFILPDDEMARMVEAFKTYGKTATG
ncbi:MAG: class II aldolase/adducin family protein [Hyphomicrobium sp.]